MSKLNKKGVVAHARKLPLGAAPQASIEAPFGRAVSANGNLQLKKGPMNELFETLVSTLYGKDSYYETSNDKVNRMRSALSKVVSRQGLKGAEFAGRVALFAREHMYIRTMPIVMVVELAKIMQARTMKFNTICAGILNHIQEKAKTLEPMDVDLALISELYDGTFNMPADSGVKSFSYNELMNLHQTLVSNPLMYNMRKLVSGVISRADELTDLFAYALTRFGSAQKTPMSVKRGVADAFNKFDAYQFGKYNHDNKLKLRDLLRIVHPEPANEEKSVIFKKIMEETLESPFTWEVELSANGQLPVAERMSKKDLWEKLINRKGSGSLGYMALIRNLRNMAEAGISSDVWREVAERIKNPNAVAKSKQLPFAFINAYNVAKESNVPRLVMSAIEEATELSLSNMPKMGDNVWVILDASGSMGGNSWNQYSNGQNPPIMTGAIFASALVKASKNSFNVAFTMFDDDAKHVELNPKSSIFDMYEKIMHRNAGGGTNLQSALNEKSNLGFEPDTVIVLSDMEVNSLSGRKTNIFNSKCVKVAVNLDSRGSTPVSEIDGWIQLSGWSPRIFDFVKFTRDSTSIVQQLYDGTIPLRGEVVEELVEE